MAELKLLASFDDRLGASLQVAMRLLNLFGLDRIPHETLLARPPFNCNCSV